MGKTRQRKPDRAADKLLTMFGAIAEAAHKQGYGVQLTRLPGKPAKLSIQDKNASGFKRTMQRDIIAQKSRDLAWLGHQLASNGWSKLIGNYVALHNTAIISFGPIEKLVRKAAAHQLGIKEQDVLVVPVQVNGPDSEDSWLEIRSKLGLM